MGISILAQFDELRALFVTTGGAGTLTLSGVFQELRLIDAANQAIAGSGKLKHNARLLKLVNNTNADIYISFDPLATIINDMIPAGGFALYDLTTNRSNMGGDFLLGEGIFILAETVPGAPALIAGGAVYATVVYGKGE